MLKFEFDVDGGVMTATDERGNEREAIMNAEQAMMMDQIAASIMTANLIGVDCNREENAKRLNFFWHLAFNTFKD